MLTDKLYDHLFSFVLQLKTKGTTEDTLDFIVQEVKIICEFSFDSCVGDRSQEFTIEQEVSYLNCFSSISNFYFITNFN